MHLQHDDEEEEEGNGPEGKEDQAQGTNTLKGLHPIARVPFVERYDEGNCEAAAMTLSKPALWERLPKWLVPALGYTIGALSLFWVLFSFPYAQLGEHLRTLDWKWVGIAI